VGDKMVSIPFTKSGQLHLDALNWIITLSNKFPSRSQSPVNYTSYGAEDLGGGQNVSIPFTKSGQLHPKGKRIAFNQFRY